MGRRALKPLAAALGVALLLTACGGSGAAPADPADIAVDSGPAAIDTGPDLVEPSDPGPAVDDTPQVEDTGSDVADEPPSPFGSIAGTCEALVAELEGDAPGIFVNTFVFDGDPFDAGDLDPDAKAIFDEPNAGGSSKCSEVFSMEVMDDCLGADLYKTETRIEYVAAGSLTDYAMIVEGSRVGVSVTRAYKGPIVEYSVAEAITLLTKKLAAVLESTANVAPADAWERQILHVWTLHPEWADMVVEAWGTLGPELQADTLVVVTVETGTDFVTTDTCDDPTR